MKIPSLLAVALAASIAAVHAQSTWTGGGGVDTNWDTAGNWDVVPGAGADVVFASGLAAGTTTAVNRINTNGNRSVGSLTLGANSLSNYGLTGGAGDTLSISTGVNYINTINSNIELRVPTIDVGTNATTWDGNGIGSFNVFSNLTGSGTITKSGSHTLRFHGGNAGFSGGFTLTNGNINADFGTSDANRDTIFGTGTITFASTDAASPAVQLNMSKPETTWSNAIVNNNSGTGNASFRFTGGTQRGGVVTLAGPFSTGANIADDARLSFSARVGFNDSNRAEGRWNLSGDWSGYSPGGNPVIAMGEGTLQIDAQQAIAPSNVTYAFDGLSSNSFASNTTKVESGIGSATSKLILNGAFTMANTINISNGEGANGTGPTATTSKSVGSTNAASTTATISGNINHNTDAAANLFSLNAGAILQVSGQIASSGGNRKLSINDTYSYAAGFGPGLEVVTRNPVGTVEFTNANTYASDTRVVAGTLLVNNSSGSATGSGNVTVEAAATLGGTGSVAPDANNLVVINGTLQAGYSGLTSGTDLAVSTSGTGSTTLGSSSNILLSLWSTTGTDQSSLLAAADLIDFGGDVNINGGATLTLGNPNALTFQNGDVFKLFDWIDATPTGMWTLDDSALNLGAAGLLLDASDLYTGGTVSIGAIPEPSRVALLFAGAFALLMRRRR